LFAEAQSRTIAISDENFMTTNTPFEKPELSLAEIRTLMGIGLEPEPATDQGQPDETGDFIINLARSRMPQKRARSDASTSSSLSAKRQKGQAENLAKKVPKICSVLRTASAPFVENGAQSLAVKPETESVFLRKLSDFCFPLRLV
jgi:hypothetical protein